MKINPKIISLLKGISKLTNRDDISYQELLNLGKKYGFTKLINFDLYQIYDNYRASNLEWEDIELEDSPFLFKSLLDKIKFISKNLDKIEIVFPSDTVDPYFYNDIKKSYTPNIEFTHRGVQFTFNYNDDTNDGLDMLNIGDDQYRLYTNATNDYSDGGYRPEDYGDGNDRYLIIGLFNKENRKLLATILNYLGKPELSRSLMKKNISDYDYVKIGEVLEAYHQKFGGKHQDDFITDIENEWCNLAQSASQDSVGAEFKDHLEGILFNNKYEFTVPYEKMIKYLTENPDIQTFIAIKDKPIIDNDLNLDDAYYQYWDIDMDEFNRCVNRQLESLLSKIESEMDNEESPYRKVVNNVNDFLKILKDLKFKKSKTTDQYTKTLPNKVITIPIKDIDYENGIVYITIRTKNNEGNVETKQHKIPFEDLTNYTLSNQLFERVVKLINK